MRFSTIQNSLFFILLTFSTFAILYIIKDFLQPIFWAVVLGIVFYPLYKKISTLTKLKDSVTSLITLALMVVIFIIPLYTLSVLVAHQAIDTYKTIAQNNTLDSTTQLLTYLDTFKQPLTDIGINIDSIKNNITALIKSAVSYIGHQAISIGKNTANIVIQFFIVLYLLFFVFKDGEKTLKKIRQALPLGDTKEKRIFAQFTSITRAIFKGTLIIALLQGSISGLLFFIAGIHSALLWGVLMTLLAIIPAVGPSLLLIPAGILLLATGSAWQGILLLVGALLISVLDNILRPILVGKDIEMHDVVITVSMLGGLGLLGFSGLIIGPIIAGFFFTMWDLFEKDYKKELKERG